MFKIITCAFILASASQAFAQKYSITCMAEDNTIRVTANMDNESEPHYLEIFNPGGLGPNFLESSYVATKSELSFNEIKASFPLGIKIDTEENYIILPGSKKKIDLVDCVRG